MKIGVIADDFTGASDIALTLAEAGMSVAQFIGVPDMQADADLDAGVVALKSRTAPVAQAVQESLDACAWLTAQGAEQIVFKVCSTFDSTPDGNIGPVLEALAAKLGARHIMTCPAFPENGRSVYQGHLFVSDVLLSESGMQNHPLTPMTDPDLRRVLGAQTSWPVSHIPAQTVTKGAEAIRAALPAEPAMIIVDAIHDEDLMTIGRAAKGEVLLCGGSGIALGLPANFGRKHKAPNWTPVTGKAVVISGSCSIATRAQVDQYRSVAPSFEVTAEAAVSGEITPQILADWVLSQSDAPLVYSSADPDVVRATQQRFGRATAADAIEALFSDLAAILSDRGVSRLVVAGGETSGAVVNGLKARELKIGPRIAAGVPVVHVGGTGMALALKSGNFGDTDFFETALKMMETAS
ncbi:four-carbon acid sugar kinase family protein [Shimia thalassica]|uniref:3-oxo-tetronate kinase n=1 Tax=Shimia thalassica TaxID=1715693 RepID=UPI001C0A3427|nr:3-oxo-tetronate kinase [Shimia thalassica]MBU2941910.1 four-carbon acid sugar kinase family protein [Shimia thalassica]MDO6505251.1 four-carbon acid sugar kinase family protein [Shimia thalassica]